MRKATVSVWASVLGKDTKVNEINGSLSELIETIQQVVPTVSSLEIKKTLLEGAWSKKLTWVGNHTIGLEVIDLL